MRHSRNRAKDWRYWYQGGTNETLNILMLFRILMDIPFKSSRGPHQLSFDIIKESKKYPWPSIITSHSNRCRAMSRRIQHPPNRTVRIWLKIKHKGRQSAQKCSRASLFKLTVTNDWNKQTCKERFFKAPPQQLFPQFYQLPWFKISSKSLEKFDDEFAVLAAV